ncbi:MAG: threonine synthase [Fusobacteriaceae bacterium]|jgi:threonine synthase|nr:threonine synthase [Fusobacteriaceae bacterium]
MPIYYESTRSGKIREIPENAILQGLSPDGGLYAPRDFKNTALNLSELADMDYETICRNVLEKFLGIGTEDARTLTESAYRGKFSTATPAPLVHLKDSHILELFHGPTAAFKDFGLQLLPQLTKYALEKTGFPRDILIVTATSGDTGKAALEGFKDVARTKIIVFYPFEKVSKIQELQMRTQEGDNTGVAAVRGNFDDAQNGVKALFTDKEFLEKLDERRIRLSSANSINIGRLAAQIVYYFSAYGALIRDRFIQKGDKVNFVVPTGNFGNILAGYYAGKMGLPIHRLLCASNRNNVLTDFFLTGIYNRKRRFHTTISPSMDILISSNLERLIYHESDADAAYVKELYGQLNQRSEYKIRPQLLSRIRELFSGGFADDDTTLRTIRREFDDCGYLMDPHTAVARTVFEDFKKSRGELLGDYETVILSTASPYKFSRDVIRAFEKTGAEDEFLLMERLYKKTGVEIPAPLRNLAGKEIRHSDVIEIGEMERLIGDLLGRMS